MGGQQDNIEKVQSAYDEEKEQLDDLRERFAVLKVDYEEIMAERERIRLEEEARKKEFEERSVKKHCYRWFLFFLLMILEHTTLQLSKLSSDLTKYAKI